MSKTEQTGNRPERENENGRLIEISAQCCQTIKTKVKGATELSKNQTKYAMHMTFLMLKVSFAGRNKNWIRYCVFSISFPENIAKHICDSAVYRFATCIVKTLSFFVRNHSLMSKTLVPLGGRTIII